MTKIIIDKPVSCPSLVQEKSSKDEKRNAFGQVPKGTPQSSGWGEVELMKSKLKLRWLRVQVQETRDWRIEPPSHHMSKEGRHVSLGSQSRSSRSVPKAEELKQIDYKAESSVYKAEVASSTNARGVRREFDSTQGETRAFHDIYSKDKLSSRIISRGEASPSRAEMLYRNEVQRPSYTREKPGRFPTIIQRVLTK
ncbi:hypothetical protein CRG98_014955 [Punica granatum]|uniref:Uncharacterized protein n=1 Tax=Punica granatum TaxID=22663 RepID=A0A2I0KA96_PUNGR|nr:hypothetical protein CRG98_014955 [Punica granatum]